MNSSLLEPPQRILIIRLSAIGDVLFTLPAFAAVRAEFPNAEIDWLIEDKSQSILDFVPGLNRRVVYPRKQLASAWKNPLRWPAVVRVASGHLKTLRANRYDVILDFQGNLKSGVQAWLARGGPRFGFGKGFGKEGNHWFQHRTVEPRGTKIHRRQKLLDLARGAFPQLNQEPVLPQLVVAREQREAVAAKLADTGLERDQPFVVLHPGTSVFGAFKRWAPDRFGHLGDRLAAEGLATLVSWGPGEESLARAVLSVMKSGRGLLAPECSLSELAALLQHARLVIGADSAPVHLASMLGTGVVALFGPKDPVLYGPWFSPHRVVRSAVPCSPCLRRTCPDVLCMEEIRIRHVFEAAMAVLEETRVTARRRDSGRV